MRANLIPALSCVLLTSCASQPSGAQTGASASASNACIDAASGAPRGDEWLEVWVDLSEPPLSSRGESDQDAQREKIEAQQNRVASALRELGARELSRVSIVRNAIAVCLPARALDDARRLQGVVKVRPVKHRQQTP